MQVFSAALADAGFDVYSIDLPGHGDSIAGFSATRARSVVAQALDQLGAVDVAVGHSLGAGLLLDLANERSLPRTVLLSPPPTPTGNVDVSRMLVVTGVWDIPAINAFVPRLEGAEWWELPWAAHSSAVFNAGQTRDIVRWMGGDFHAVRTASRVLWYALMLLAAAGLGASLLPARPWTRAQTGLGMAEACAWMVLAGIPTLAFLHFVVVLKWLHLFATDYLLSVFFLTGTLLSPAAMIRRHQGPATPAASVDRRQEHLIAILAAIYVIGAVGLFAGSHFMHFTLTDGRWWRFPVIAAASFPLFYFDEIALRTGPGWRVAATGVLTKSLMGAAIVTGVLILNRQQAFLVLIAHLVVLFWIALWFLTEIVRRHTQNPVAAALFAALAQGWVFAAWFVTT